MVFPLVEVQGFPILSSMLLRFLQLLFTTGMVYQALNIGEGKVFSLGK